MKRLIALITVLCPPVFAFFASKEKVCNYYDNPNLAHYLTGDQYPHQPYAPEDYPNLNVFYDGRQMEPGKMDLMRSLNFGYLNLNAPLSSLHDLYELNSDEIGTPYRQEPKVEPPKVWKVDDVKSLAPPQVLPDVDLNIARHDSYDIQNYPQALDEQERKLGRTLVQDIPALSDVLGVEKSLTQEVDDMGKMELDEKYLRSPGYYQKAPSVVLNKVVHRKEPTFMDELRDIKKSTFQNRQFVPDALPSDAKKIPLPIVTFIETSTIRPEQENTIEKESNASLAQTSLENIGVIPETPAVKPEPSTSSKPKIKRLRQRPGKPETEKPIEDNKNETTLGELSKMMGSLEILETDISTPAVKPKPSTSSKPKIKTLGQGPEKPEREKLIEDNKNETTLGKLSEMMGGLEILETDISTPAVKAKPSTFSKPKIETLRQRPEKPETEKLIEDKKNETTLGEVSKMGDLEIPQTDISTWAENQEDLYTDDIVTENGENTQDDVSMAKESKDKQIHDIEKENEENAQDDVSMVTESKENSLAHISIMVGNSQVNISKVAENEEKPAS